MNNKQDYEKIIFILLFLFSMFNMNSDMVGSYWGLNGTPFFIMRFAIVIVLMTVAAIINRNNLDFVTRFVPPSTLVITGLVLFDYYVTHISGSHFLYRVLWIAYIIVTLMTLFVVISLFCKEGYADFYRKFWRSFVPLYLFILSVCFMRMPGDKANVNFELGNGTFLMLKALINNINVTFEAPLMFFGNLAIFVPVPFILSAISSKLKPPIILLIGLITPFVIETYQYVFKCGQTDIDDVVLNIGGFIIAFIVYLIIYKRKLNNKDTA